MKPGSSDSVLTLLGSLLVAFLLFAGRSVIEQRLPNVQTPHRTTTETPTEQPQNETRWVDASTAHPGSAEIAAETFKVIAVVDGDTVDLLVNQQPLRLRLNGVDTPEKGQPFGNTAKQALSKLVAGKRVTYVVRDTDRYNRSIADLYVEGVHVNLWLVQQGLAWHYTAYSDDLALATAEQMAKKAGRGLWSDPRRVAPWNWRKLSKVERDTYR